MVIQKLNVPDIPGVSLVAYYGKKSLVFQQLIVNLQQRLKEKFAESFMAYDLEQIHATIIGCEGIKTEEGIVNKWFYTLRNEIKYIDYPGLLNYFFYSNILPAEIYFAGYQPKINYQFYSRKQHPCDRSFQLQVSGDQQLIPILMGWSMKNKVITTEIEQIRRDLQQFNCLHKYHKSAQDIDNDVYLRLGTITKTFPVEKLEKIQQEIRQYLQHLAPIRLPLTLEDLAIVKYQDLTLPLTTTESYSLAEFKFKNNFAFVQDLYEAKAITS